MSKLTFDINDFIDMMQKYDEITKLALEVANAVSSDPLKSKLIKNLKVYSSSPWFGEYFIDSVKAWELNNSIINALNIVKNVSYAYTHNKGEFSQEEIDVVDKAKYVQNEREE